MSLECDNLDDIAERIRVLIKPKVPESFMDKVALLPTLLEVGRFPPKLSSAAAPCQEVVLTDPTQPMLDKLPIIKCWPEDGGSFVTLGVVITRDPKNQIRNLGVYRLQKYDNVTTGMHWHKHHDGAKHFEEKRRENIDQKSRAVAPRDNEPPNYGTIFSDAPETTRPSNKLEVAIAIGADPAVTYAATAPLPPDIDEFLFAGFLRQSPVKLVKCKTIDLEVRQMQKLLLKDTSIKTSFDLKGHLGTTLASIAWLELSPYCMSLL